MSQQTPTTPTEHADADKLLWSPRVRGIVSAVLAFHVAAVFIAPWSGPPPASQLSQSVAGWIRPYLNAVNINHGYRFFAPNPGASHLVRYELLLRDGNVERGQFPNLEEHWPRLLYHRHFMVAETVHNLREQTTTVFAQPVPPHEIPGYNRMTRGEQQQVHAEFQAAGRMHNEARRRLDRLVRPIAQRLMIEHDAEAVELWLVEHRIPFRQRVVNGVELTNPDLYVQNPLGRFQRE